MAWIILALLLALAQAQPAPTEVISGPCYDIKANQRFEHTLSMSSLGTITDFIIDTDLNIDKSPLKRTTITDSTQFETIAFNHTMTLSWTPTSSQAQLVHALCYEPVFEDNTRPTWEGPKQKVCLKLGPKADPPKLVDIVPRRGEFVNREEMKFILTFDRPIQPAPTGKSILFKVKDSTWDQTFNYPTNDNSSWPWGYRIRVLPDSPEEAIFELGGELAPYYDLSLIGGLEEGAFITLDECPGEVAALDDPGYWTFRTPDNSAPYLTFKVGGVEVYSSESDLIMTNGTSSVSNDHDDALNCPCSRKTFGRSLGPAAMIPPSSPSVSSCSSFLVTPMPGKRQRHAKMSLYQMALPWASGCPTRTS